MAKRAMLKVDIFGLKKDRKAVLETIQRMGVIEVAPRDPKSSVFSRTDTVPMVSQLERHIQSTDSALTVLDSYDKEKTSMLSSLSGRALMSVDDYEQCSSESDKTLKICLEIIELERKISEKKGEIVRVENQIAALEPWKTLDVSQRFKGTGQTRAFIGTFPAEWTLEGILTKLAEQNAELPVPYVEVVSVSREQTCVFILSSQADAPALEEELRGMGFSRPATPSNVPPAEKLKMLEGDVKCLKEEIEKSREAIVAYADKRSALKMERDILVMRRDKYEVIATLNQSPKTFMLSGFVPADCEEELNGALAKFDCVVETRPPGAKEEVPVALRNNRFNSPTESVIEMYSMPSKTDVDPASVMAIFYYILFGMMLSDAAYGLIVVVGCFWALRKFKNMEHGMRRALTMFMYSGIATIFWGIMFSSYFGDIVTVVAKNFFHANVVIPPLWFAPLDNPMLLLMFSFLLGIVHLFTGMGVALYEKIRDKQYKDAFLDVGLWILLVLSLILLLLTTQMFADIAQLGFMLPSSWAGPLGIIALLSALGIILFGGRDSRNPFKRILKGLYSLYNITGYLSDILSYSRLLALGLATGIIASVINMMAAMTAGMPYGIGVILFTVICIGGHALNIAINLLGAYVHTNRLQFVEFFGKFYEGGGRTFAPFAVKTKYYKFKEEE